MYNVSMIKASLSKQQQQFLAYTIVTKGSMSRYRPTVCLQTDLPKVLVTGHQDTIILRFCLSSWPEFPSKVSQKCSLLPRGRVLQIPERLISYETYNKIINQNCFAHDIVT